MLKTTLKLTTVFAAGAFVASTAIAADNYGPFPITEKSYSGDKTNSVSYSGQIARHVLEKSLKSLAGKGDGSNAAELEALMLAYFNGSDEDLPIVSPSSKDGFEIKQKTVNEISKGKNISGKFYKGAMPAWPGNMNGVEVVEHMIQKAAASTKGFDADNGYDWGQLISKYTMGGMSYSQAVDNYLDEKLSADNKPNNKPYKDGAYYTGKEHSWDEGFGYWGAPAHTLSLDPSQAYNIAKGKDLAAGDANGDGVIDLKSEFVFGPAYYAAGADKGGSKTTNYLPTIMKAFIDGRQVITDADGAALTDAQRGQLVAYAAIIEENWEKVLAEAAFKYAGSVYNDINTMKEIGVEDEKAYRNYVKHWGELKGFAMALQTGKSNLGGTAVELNELIGFGPVTRDNSYVTGLDEDGNFVRERKMTWSDYQLNMLKTQKLLAEQFGLKSRANDVLAELDKLAAKLGADSNAETD